METPNTNALYSQVLSNQVFLTELFLVQAWVTNEDVIRLGFADSSAAAEALLESLQACGLVQKQEPGYTCSSEMLNWVSELLPPKNDIDILRRAMRKHFQPAVQEKMVSSTLASLSALNAGHPLYRPKWYFDLTAIIHPALTIDVELNITECSNALCDFLRPAYPSLREQVETGKLNVVTFLRNLDLYHFDYETLEPTDAHILDPTPKFPGLLKHLADNDSVDKKPVFLRMGKLEHYLELSFALQVTFQGAQSIWHIVDRRVGQMRLVRAMHFTKWFITAHRLKQPTNLFNIARAELEVAQWRGLQEELSQQYIQAKLSEAIDILSIGIEEFNRFVVEISGREYQIVTNMEKTEDVDVIAVLEDVYTDVDYIYAKPLGIRMILEINSVHDTSYFIHTSHFLLREALFNIIHNAFKHGSRYVTNPEIHVRCTSSVSTLIIEVEDKGQGMSTREIEEYIKAFENMRPTISPAENGALSGLALAMSVIKNSGGKVAFNNIHPTGFRTTITFQEN